MKSSSCATPINGRMTQSNYKWYGRSFCVCVWCQAHFCRTIVFRLRLDSVSQANSGFFKRSTEIVNSWNEEKKTITSSKKQKLVPHFIQLANFSAPLCVSILCDFPVTLRNICREKSNTVWIWNFERYWILEREENDKIAREFYDTVFGRFLVSWTRATLTESGQSGDVAAFVCVCVCVQKLSTNSEDNSSSIQHHNILGTMAQGETCLKASHNVKLLSIDIPQNDSNLHMLNFNRSWYFIPLWATH